MTTDELRKLRKDVDSNDWNARAGSSPQWWVCSGNSKFGIVVITARRDDEARAKYIAAMHNELPSLLDAKDENAKLKRQLSAAKAKIADLEAEVEREEKWSRLKGRPGPTL